MKLFAIDTSGNTTRWVGIEDGRMVDPVEIAEERRHDSVLASGIDAWLNRNVWGTLDGIAVVNGPGGYTGLRVGVAFASAFATGKGIPVVPVSTYEAVATRAPGKTVWVLLPLRKGVCRTRLMRGGDQPEPLSDAVEFIVGETKPPDVSSLLPLGDGYDRYKQEIDTQLRGFEIEPSAGVRIPLEALAIAAWEAWQQGRKFDPMEVDVDYGGEFQPTPKHGKR